MVFVLVALAALQYRWSERVTDATQARIDASLQASIMDWHLSLLRAVAEPAFAMRISSEPDSKEDPRIYFERYRSWYQTADRPALFANFYVVDVPAAGDDRISRLDVGDGHLQPDQAPARLAALLSELHRQSADRETLVRAATGNSRMKAENLAGALPHDPLFGWQFEENLPALVHPLFSNSKIRDGAHAVSWIVIELDPKVLQQQLLPELAQHYFGGPPGANYDTAVIAGHTERVLYSSSPTFLDHPFDHPDAVLDIFGPPSTGGATLSHDFAGDFHSGAEHGDTTGALRNMTAPSWLPLLQDAGNNPPWNLVVRHLGGSLEVQMEDVRRRDLAVSLGILLLLGATMAMLIIATRRAQRLAQLQMDFVATVSHELRTPLAVICSAADNLSDGIVSGPQQLARYGETIKIQGKQLIALVEQILLFASTRDGHQLFHYEFLDVEKIVDVVLGNTAGLIEVSAVRLESEIEPDLPQVVADLAAISQCVQNLVINAVKYGGDAKWIRVTARRVANEIQIAVKDRGIGMSSSELAHIFEPFYRSPQVAAAQIRGTGLGLPLAKSLAESMKGSLTVESEEGKGSTFILHLPFAQDSPLRSAVPQPSNGVCA